MQGGKHWDGDGVPLKDSNCAGIGSDEDKALRKQAAQTEPAWQGAGLAVGIEIWRVEQFQVKPWPKKKYGQFHQGDSYIVLQTTKDPTSEKLLHGIFFWLGKDTTTDEMGVAAYKTVELDDFFDGEPTQHREVMGHESQQFLGIFPKITYLRGGTATGFRKSAGAAELYETRLLQVRKTAKGSIRVTEVPRARDSLNEGDCFVLDAGAKIYIWEGKDASPYEKNKANMVAENMEAERDGKATATHDLDESFWMMLGGKGPIKGADEVDDRPPPLQPEETKLYQVSDADGSLRCTEVGRGKTLSASLLKSEDVMMLAAAAELFLWIGLGASTTENRSALRLAMDYLKANGKPLTTPIHVFKEGQKVRNTTWNETFALAGGRSPALACFAWCA